MCLESGTANGAKACVCVYVCMCMCVCVYVCVWCLEFKCGNASTDILELLWLAVKVIDRDTLNLTKKSGVSQLLVLKCYGRFNSGTK